MPHKKLSRNAPCPCGSGKKYKACCWDKGFEWVEDEAGTVFRSSPMTPEVREALEQLRQAFIAKHGLDHRFGQSPEGSSDLGPLLGRTCR